MRVFHGSRPFAFLFFATLVMMGSLVVNRWPLLLVAGALTIAVGVPVARDRASSAGQLARLLTVRGVPTPRLVVQAIGAGYVVVGLILIAGAIQRLI
jgi:hypothetical protein